MTNNLERRLKEHKAKKPGSFTARYNVNRLVYFEEHHRAWDAIMREKQVKRWTRAKRVALIESMNPTWRDLSWSWEE